MKKINLLVGTLVIAFAAVLMSLCPADEVMTNEDGMTVVNTTTLTVGTKGYVDNTPLLVYFQDGKIAKIKALKTKETPKYFAQVKSGMFPKWEGMTAKKAEKAKVDTVTGATMSSKAVIKNVQKACEYYNKNAK